MNILAASREVSTPSSNPQIFNLHYAASGGEFDPKMQTLRYKLFAKAAYITTESRNRS